MDIVRLVDEVLLNAEEDFSLPLPGETLRTYAVLAANRHVMAEGLDVGSSAWWEAYEAAHASLEARNRLHSEWEG